MRIRTTQRGQLVMVVLWVMGLVSLAIGALTVRATHEVRLGRIPLESLQRKAIAQAAVRQAAALLQADEPELDHLGEAWATGIDEESGAQLLTGIAVGPGQFAVGVPAEDGTFLIGLIDEERKLNVNIAAEAVLGQLIGALGVGEVDPSQVAAAIVDWRDEPEGAFCSGAEPPCHNAPMTSLDELRLIQGITPTLLAALTPYVTVHGAGVVNVNTASALVLTALGEPGETLVEQRAVEPFTSYPGLAVASTVFTVPVEAWLADGTAIVRLQAIVDREGQILRWLPQ